MKDRQELPTFAVGRGARTCVEIGVDLAVYSKVILDSHPDVHLYGIDPWTPYPEIPYDRKESFEIAMNRLRPYGKRITVIPYISMAAAHLVPDGVDFVYVDGAHDHISVTADLFVWYGKLKDGGILAGHDFDLPTVRDSALYLAGFFGLELHIIPDRGDINKKDPFGFWAHPTYYVIKEGEKR